MPFGNASEKKQLKYLEQDEAADMAARNKPMPKVEDKGYVTGGHGTTQPKPQPQKRTTGMDIFMNIMKKKFGYDK